MVAKRRGDEWYVGGMTDWTARMVEIDFSFLPSGMTFKAEIFRDDFESNLYADRYKAERIRINADTRLPMRMASGGGFAIRLVPES